MARQPAKTAAAEPESPTGMWRITVSSVDRDAPAGPYLPGQAYDVNAEVLKALGDKVATKSAIETLG